MNVFDLLAKISLDSSEYESGLNDAESKTSKFGESLKSGLGNAAKVAGAAMVALGTTVATGTKALINGVSATAAYGDEIDKTSQKLGLSTEAYQEWDYVLKLAGTEMSSMTTGLKTLTNKMDDARNGSEDAQKMFAKLGISMDDLATMSREDIFAATIKGFQQMEDSTERAALANDLYGKSGQNLTPLFNQTAEQTEEQIRLAREYGMVMSDDMVKGAAHFQDSLTTAKGAVTGLKNSLLGELLPSFTEVLDGFAALVSGEDETGDMLTQGIGNAIDSVTDMLPRLLNAGGRILMALVNGISQNLPEIVSAAQTLLSTLIQAFIDMLPSILEMLPDILSNALELIVNVITAIVNALPTLIRIIGKELPNIIRTLARYLPVIIRAILEGLPDIIAAICEALPEIIIAIIEVLPDLIAQIAEAVFSNFPLILAAVVQGLGTILARLGEWFLELIGFTDKEGDGILDDVGAWFGELWNNIGSALANLWTNISNWFADVWNSIGEKINEAIEWGKNLVTGLWDGISQTASWLWDNISGWIGGVWDGILDFFGIHSPSKEMAWMGKMLVEGFGGGIEKYGDEAIDAALGVAHDVQDAFGTASYDSSYSLGGTSNAYSEYEMIVQALKDAIMQVKIEMDEEEMARFVDKTVTRLVYAS